MLQLVITYIWFGSVVPERYLLRFAEVDYPARLLINPVNNMSYPLNIQKADRYRLEYLKNGGVYADFDTIIRYDSIMQHLTNFKGQMLVPDFQGEEWKQKVNNNFIYVPADNTSLIRQILQKQGKNCGRDVSFCNGGYMLQKYRDRISVENIDCCVGHQFDWSWGKETTRLQRLVLLFTRATLVSAVATLLIILIQILIKSKKQTSNSIELASNSLVEFPQENVEPE